MTHPTIEQTIAVLENARQTLGDAAVEASIAALRRAQTSNHRHELSSATLRGERRQVTVMFADISGFTAMSERLDPEEVRSMINACFDRLGAALDRYGGHIDKFIGDEIMALFGAPTAHENDPERALRAALDMMETLETFNHEHADQLPRPLALHFGINSGLVIAGGIGTSRRQDYSVMGDTVNLAARLEDLSEAGEILVGENTYRQTAPFFEFSPPKSVKVKGKAEPVRVYRLLKARTMAGGQIRGIEGLYSPLVGRAAEMASLQQALQRFHDGQGSVVAVIGEAGFGKSRLITEFQSSWTGRDQALWADGRALSHADSVSYLVARDALRHLLGIGGDAAPAEAAALLQAEIEAVLPGQSAALLPYLAHLLEIPLDDAAQQRIKYLEGEALHQRIFEASRDFLAAKSRQTPLALVWEDLHWADPSSLALLETLLPVVDRQPVLLLLVYRRPLRGSKIWHFHHRLAPSFEQENKICLELPALTDAESGQLLDNLLGREALPAEIRNKIVAKAEGNPFYLEEVIRSLIDKQAIVRAGPEQRWAATAGLQDIHLPDTLQGVIMARVDQLNAQTKRVLQVAAVIGRSFPRDVLAQVANLPSAGEALDTLHTLDLITTRQSSPRVEYAFKHVFTQESVYNSLLRSDRVQLHRLVGEALESLVSDKFTETDGAVMLAYHFEQGQERERALKYLRLAGAHAAKTFANREADILYRRALTLLDRGDYPTRWEVLTEQEPVLDRLGERERQAEVLVQMQTLAELLADERRAAITHNRRAHYFDKISEYQAAAEAANVGLRVARRSADDQLQAHSLNLLALAAWRRFDYRQVQQWAEQALFALTVVGDPGVRITSLFHLGKASYRLGQYDLALRYTRAAQELTHELGNRDGEATSHMILGWIYQRLGDYDRAEEHFEAKLRVRQTIGDRYGEATALSHLGWLACDRQQPQAGLRYCRQALEISRSINDRENEAYALSGLGLSHEQLAQPEAALAHYRAALDRHAEIGATTLAIFDRAGLARIALTQSDRAAARVHIRVVADWVLSGNAQKFWDPWSIYLSSYEVLTALGEAETAHQILAEARHLLHQRADEISDEGLRRCFLEKVAVNRRLEAAWGELSDA